MLIFWSVRLRRRPIGHVAALCPVRRVVEGFEWWECRRALHLCFVPLERGKLVYCELRAERGRLIFQAAPDAFPYVEGRAAEITFDDLVSRTNPGVRDIEAMAIEADAIAAAQSPGSPDRLRAMLQRFEALEYVYRLRASSGPSESITAVVALIAVCSLAAAAIAIHQSFSWWIWPCATSAIFFPAAVYRTVISTRRSGWRPIEPYIIESLALLAPTVDELETVRQLLRRSGYEIATSIRADSVAREAGALRQRVSNVTTMQ